MARSNKYTSLNFNDIYDKKSSSSSSSAAAAAHRPHSSSSSSSPSSSKTIISNSRIHGHMLVMSRPTPKPIAIPQPQTTPIEQNRKFQSPPERSPSDSDSISLRPRGRTGSGPVISSNTLSSPGKPSSLPKSDRFVPPHLRPGFVGREEKLVTEFQKGRGRGEFAGGLLHAGPENGRPKSGGGYERMGPGRDGEPVISMNRPRSSGARPRSSG